MACIKSVNRSASVALSPESPYMAAGTMAGAVDLSFSTSAFLEIFSLDFQSSDDHELPVLAQSTSSERFNRLSWGRTGSNSEEFGLGLIAGGLIDGTIGLWNPLPLIRPETNSNPVVGQLSRHKGPVRGLEFNAITPNLLASGADDGEICIWDLASPNDPTHFPPLRGTGSAAQGEISYLSWNSKVQHILASTSYNGTTVVWDLKKQKPVISFADSTRRRCSVLQWNPDVATQLIVASDDDNSPSLRLWDMRNTMSPVKEFVAHTKGVISMAWCPSDSSYLLTCAKDNRTICWDTVSGEIVCELPAGTNWNFDVHWYPKIPGVISASSFDGKIGIYNIEACSRYGVAETDFGAAPLRAPKWYKRPVGVSFGFGGKLVSFHSKAASPGAPLGGSEVYVHSLVTEDGLVTRSSEFEAAIRNGERSSLRVLCEKKSEESELEDDRETWGFLKAMFEDDGTARTKLLSHLGFSVPEEEKETVEDDLSQQASTLGLEDEVTEKVADVADKPTALIAEDNGEDFFNNLPDTPVSTTVNSFVAEAVPSEEQKHVEHDVPEESDDPAFDDAVQRALVVGDYKGAVEQCIAANKMADALVIANVGGSSLWESTRDKYLKISRSPYLKVVSAMVNHDLMSLVNSRPLKSWKETLALLCTFAPREEWTVLCDALASKLLAAGNTLAATLCYICAANIDKTVEIWSRGLSAEPEGKSYVDRLQDLMEKTIVFALASGQKQFSSFLCKLVEKYAEILASQGQLSSAMEYLKLLGEDLSPELVILRDRIAVSWQPEKEAEKPTYENPSVTGHVYGGDGNYAAGNSGFYYPEPAPSPMQPASDPNSYPGNYGQSYNVHDNNYAAPVNQPTPPTPGYFVPSQPQQAPPPKFAPQAPINQHQPAGRQFVPAPSAPLKNAENYHQPATLGPQLVPGMPNSNYQPGPPGPGSVGPMVPQPGGGFPTQRLPQVVAPTQPPVGFMPVTSAGVGAQRPGMISQPSSPAQSASPQTAVTPPAPPPTVQTVDTSNVPAHQKPVVGTLTRLFNETSDVLGGARANAAKKREIEDNSRKLGALFAKLNTGDISKNASDKLVQLCQALDNGDFPTALQFQVLLTTSEWDECSVWLGNLKRMIKTRQNVRL